MKKKKILVVGGAGYLGGAITDIILNNKDKYSFRVYDTLLYEESYRKPVDFIYGDILDKEKLLKQLNWADCVIWLAAIVGDGACKWDEVLTVKTNEESIKWLSKNFSKRIIFTSTCSVYGAQNDTILREDSNVAPLSLYGFTKLKAEGFLKDNDAVIFRLGTLFGVSDTYSRLRMDLVVNLMTARAHFTGSLSVFGGRQYRPLLHVRDAAKTIVNALDFKKMKNSEIFNLCKTNISMIDLANHIKKHYPRVNIEITEMPFEDTRNYQVSCDKAKRSFGFDPKLDLDFGIGQLKELFSENRIKNFNNPRYSNQLFLKDVLNKQ